MSTARRAASKADASTLRESFHLAYRRTLGFDEPDVRVPWELRLIVVEERHLPHPTPTTPTTTTAAAPARRSRRDHRQTPTATPTRGQLPAASRDRPAELRAHTDTHPSQTLASVEHAHQGLTIR
jgi:hypothetical protein